MRTSWPVILGSLALFLGSAHPIRAEGNVSSSSESTAPAAPNTRQSAGSAGPGIDNAQSSSAALAQELIGQPLRDTDGIDVGVIADVLIFQEGATTVLLRPMGSSAFILLPLELLIKTSKGATIGMAAQTFADLPKYFSTLPADVASVRSGQIPPGTAVLTLTPSFSNAPPQLRVPNASQRPGVLAPDAAQQLRDPYTKSRDAIKDIWKQSR